MPQPDRTPSAAYALITTAHADLLGEYDTRAEAEEAAEKVRGLGEQVEIIELDANGRKKSAAQDREFLTDVRVRASNLLTDYLCAHWDRNDPDYPDPADVHEDVREALWPFFLEIRDRFGVEGDV